MAFKEEWIRLQKNLVEAIRDETFPSGREGSDEFRNYLRRYSESMPRSWEPASLEELTSLANGARAIVVGDYHTNPYSSNMVLWLLETLDRLGRDVTIFLEALPDGFQEKIAAFARAEIDESAFLSAVGYHASFGFDWNLYRPIVSAANRIGSPICGINVRAPGISLDARDRFGASVVAGELFRVGKRLPSGDHVALILVGEKHLAPPHLEESLRAALDEKGIGGPVVNVHCNVPSLYFDFLSNGYRGTPALFKDRSGRICALEVSPLTLKAGDLNWFHREQSNWLVPDFGQGAHRGPNAGDGEDEVHFDEAGLFARVVSELSVFLDCDARGLEDFHVYAGDEMIFEERFGRDGMSTVRIHALLEEAQRTECLYVADYCLAWMKEMTPAHLGRTAALHLAASRSDGTTDAPTFTGVLGALGAALLDPYIAHESLVPRRHPALRHTFRQRFASGERREDVGFDLGLKVFRALAGNRVSFDAVRALFRSPARMHSVLDRIFPLLS